MKTLELEVVGGNRSKTIQFQVKRMINAGYVGRNRQAVTDHIEELRRQGVPPPSSVPMIFPVLCHNITTANKIEVVGRKTSGEVEFVLLLNSDNIFVGVGSDHTDRDIERHSIIKSKQVCPNAISKQVWNYDDVKSSWDDLILQSKVKMTDGGEAILYQKAPTGSIISATELMDLVKSKIIDGMDDGLVLFSGTLPVLTDEIVYGSHFRCELIDLRLDRVLACEYKINTLDYLKP
ncbi:MAG: DUF2848 family protein [Desulfobacterales bacterium]|jgi:hypothetical protein|nr:DUF2848 family protein [Desulfobacterales bacterium]MDP6808509.1 DUF2848 family protein [Desulfobacterales bacterium]|tara:strand:- start:45744 stop:46448 length:705 start_codon:yes stop_codon:yes gene_type:complete